ncbi:MAG: tandem-95 repeat protein [Methanobacterium sp.]|uniref:Ig-like domain-containing protein n=1 Tax=Methanobacterium sp. TaxID=2164 RepID=UPI003D64899B|nr:tandem-95 repeat protein [Methanobacterium sp.]
MAFLILGTLSASYATNITGTWSGSGTSYSSTAGPVKVTASTTTSGDAGWGTASSNTLNADGTMFSNASAASHASLLATYAWDTTPTSGSDIDLPGDDKGTGTTTFTFSRPVNNPILHIDRLGGNDGGIANGANFTLTNSGLTLTKLAGVDHLNVDSYNIWRTPEVSTSGGEASWNSGSGTAAGSVQINGNGITSVTFTWTGIGMEGTGGDAIELLWEIEAPVDLAITKTDSSDQVVAGQALTYTITVRNDGPSTILDTDTFTVTDTLPSGFTASSFMPSVGSYNSATGAWTGVTLASGGSVTLTIVGTVSPTATGTLTNIATVTPPTGVTDTNNANDQTPPTITTVDGLPVANNDIKTTPEDTPLNDSLPISDHDGPVTVVNFTVNGTTASAGGTVNIPGVGTIKINAEGTYTFTPFANYNGSVPVINYTIHDGTGNTASATLIITVTPVNDVPVARDDAVSVDEGGSLYGVVVGNDISSGDGGNVWNMVTGPVNGSLTLNPDGTYTYVPNTNYSGPDSFTYSITDADGDVSTATVTLTVNSVDSGLLQVTAQPTKVNAKTIPMQHTGVPFAMLIMAFIMVFGGFFVSKIK